MRRPEAKLNNLGFSVVELIVVILIISIMSGGVTVAISQAVNSRGEAAAKKLVSVIEKTRTQTIANQDADISCVIRRESDGNVYAVILKTVKGESLAGEVDRVKLGNSNVSITPAKAVFSEGVAGFVYGSQIASAYDDGAVSEPAVELTITFRPESGAFLSVAANTELNAGISDGGYTDIIVSSDKSWDLVLIRETGRVLVERLD